MRSNVLSVVSLVLAAAATATPQDFSKILSDISKQNNRNAKVTALRFSCVPQDCRIRPFESLQVQVLVDGEMTDKDGNVKKGRLRRAPGLLTAKDGGAVSKPFKFQGKDSDGFIDGGGGLSSILTTVSGDFTVFDTFLYAAPEKPGTYTLQCDTEGVKGELKVTVDAAAASVKKAEEVTFPAENRTGERYRSLAEHYAPVFAQETWWQPKSDFPTRFDYDNDFIGDNNWDNLEKGTSQAYIYYAAMETPSHWFLIYNAFHPRDYSDKCIAGSCHENDNEGAILAVKRDGSEFGKLMAMETLAHNNLYSYTNDSSIRSAVHSVEGRIPLRDGSHPVIFIESGGHGMFAGNDTRHGRYNMDSDQFTSGTGVTFAYKGTAERPRHANDRNVGYELLPILTHWWARATNDQNQRMFDEFQAYAPFGNRPGAKAARMGTTFLGRKEASNKAKPFWGWHDNKTLKDKVLAVGQWGLDPAYAFSRNLNFNDGQYSVDYTYNPYLGIGEDSSVTPAAPVAPAVTVANPAPAETPANSGGSLLPKLGLPVMGTQANEGWIDVEATVDGSIVFHAFEQSLTPEVLSGAPASNQNVQFSSPLPTGPGISWTIEKKSGRGQIKIAEQPSDANGNTLKVRVDDPSRGADKYVFRIRWKRG